MRHEPIRRLAECVEAIRGPSIVLRLAHHSGLYGVVFDISQTREEVAFVSNDEGRVTTVPQRAGAIVLAIVVLHVSPAEVLDGALQRGRVLRRHNQMVVIVHEREPMEVGSPVSCRGLEDLEEGPAVVIVGEDWSAIVAALDHMDCRALNMYSPSSSHAIRRSKNRAQLKPSAN